MTEPSGIVHPLIPAHVAAGTDDPMRASRAGCPVGEADDVVYTVNTEAGVRAGSSEAVLEGLRGLHLANLATVSPSGWPIAHCMHFLDLEDERGAPLIYMYTHYGTRKLLNIAHSPRVSVSFSEPGAPPAGEPLRWVRIQGRASLVMDLVERREVKAVNHARQEFTTLLDLDHQPILRIDTDVAHYTDHDGGVRGVTYRQPNTI